MFDNLPSFVRLSICLLLSTCLHGGMLFDGWMTSPAESPSAQTPVSVSLLPAVDPARSIVTERTPTPFSTTPPALEAKPESALPRPQVSSPRQAPAKTLFSKPVSAAARKPIVEPKLEQSDSGLVCMPPHDVVSGHQSGRPETDTIVSEVADQITPVQLQGVAKALHDSVEPPSHALIEAIPNYRNNPLPEYPYLARQKHWEGVVWLIVDISAEGLVDDLQVDLSCGHQVLDRAAQRTVSRWQFSPAKRAGLAVPSQVRIPVRFRLEDS